MLHACRMHAACTPHAYRMDTWIWIHSACMPHVYASLMYVCCRYSILPSVLHISVCQRSRPRELCGFRSSASSEASVQMNNIWLPSMVLGSQRAIGPCGTLKTAAKAKESCATKLAAVSDPVCTDTTTRAVVQRRGKGRCGRGLNAEGNYTNTAGRPMLKRGPVQCHSSTGHNQGDDTDDGR